MTCSIRPFIPVRIISSAGSHDSTARRTRQVHAARRNSFGRSAFIGASAPVLSDRTRSMAVERAEQQEPGDEAADMRDPGNRFPVTPHAAYPSDDIHGDPQRDQQPETAARAALKAEAKHGAEEAADRTGGTDDRLDRRGIDDEMGESARYPADQGETQHSRSADAPLDARAERQQRQH